MPEGTIKNKERKRRNREIPGFSFFYLTEEKEETEKKEIEENQEIEKKINRRKGRNRKRKKQKNRTKENKKTVVNIRNKRVENNMKLQDMIISAFAFVAALLLIPYAITWGMNGVGSMKQQTQQFNYNISLEVALQDG